MLSASGCAGIGRPRARAASCRTSELPKSIARRGPAAPLLAIGEQRSPRLRRRACALPAGGWGMPDTVISRAAPREGTGKSAGSLDANTIIAAAPDPVFVSDLEGKILQANDAVGQLLGFR